MSDKESSKRELNILAYIVYRHSDSFIMGIFTTLKKAAKYINSLDEEEITNECICVHKIILNKPYENDILMDNPIKI